MPSFSFLEHSTDTNINISNILTIISSNRQFGHHGLLYLAFFTFDAAVGCSQLTLKPDIIASNKSTRVAELSAQSNFSDSGY